MQVQRVDGRNPNNLPVFTSLSSYWPVARARLSGEWIWVTAWLALGMFLRIWSLGRFPLREDEALYAYWARLISSGQDTMLEWVAVDKPPFFIYALASFFEWFGPSLESGWMLNLLASLFDPALAAGPTYLWFPHSALGLGIVCALALCYLLCPDSLH